MKSLPKLILMQLKLFMREPVATFFTIVFPLALLLLFGFIYGNEAGGFIPELPEYGYIDLQVPALAGIVIGTVAFMTIPPATATARERKVLRRYKATPLQPVVFIMSDVVVYLLISVVGMGVLVIAAKLIFGLRFGGNWLLVIAGYLLSALSFIVLGYIIASVAPNSRMAQVIGQIIYFPLMFLSGAAIPLVTMPQNIQNFAQFNPMTQMVNLLQELWFGAGWNVLASVVLIGILIVGFIAASFLFRWE